MEEEKKYILNQVSVRLKLCEESPLYSTEQINTPRKAIDVLSDMMRQLDREQVCILNLDNHGQAINFSVTSIGNLNSTIVSVREILKASILSNASQIIMAHNHPSYRIEKPVPSKEDDVSTLNVMMSAWMVGIPLADHVIVSGGTGSIYSYKAELKDRFSIEGLQEIVGRNTGVPVFNETQTAYGEPEIAAYDLGPKRVVEPPEKESGDEEDRERKPGSIDERPSVREKLKLGRIAMETAKRQSMIKQARLKTERTV